MTRDENDDAKEPMTRIQTRNVARILDAAQEIFAERGFEGATVDGIATAAGMSKPNLHYYFKHKSDLYLAALKRTLDLWIDPLEELDPEGDPEEELGNYIARKVEFSRTNPTASRMFANEILRGAPMLSDYLGGELRELVARKAVVIRHWIDTGRLADVDPAHLIFLIWAATQHYADFAPQVRAVMGKKRLDKRDFEAAATSLSAIILRGVLPRG